MRAPINLAALDAARVHLVDLPWKSPAAKFDPLSDVPTLDALGWVLAMQHGLPSPRAALAHRNYALQLHADKRAPYPCTNLLVVFRDGMDGGDLEFPHACVTFDGADGWSLAFDGQEPHLVTPLIPLEGHPNPYRIGLTYYCPLGGDADASPA